MPDTYYHRVSHSLYCVPSIHWHIYRIIASDTFCIAHAHYITIVGAENERRTLIGSRWYLQRQHPLLELPWGLLALCRRTLSSERHPYTIIAWPDKLEEPFPFPVLHITWLIWYFTQLITIFLFMPRSFTVITSDDSDHRWFSSIHCWLTASFSELTTFQNDWWRWSSSCSLSLQDINLDL